MMDIELFIDLAKTYNDLGWAIQSHLDDLLMFGLNHNTLVPGDLNENAIQVIENFAASLPEEIDTSYLIDAIYEYTALEEYELEKYV